MAIIARRRTWTPVDEAIAPGQRFNALIQEGISILELPAKTANLLEQSGIITVERLLERQPEQILEIKNFGVRALREIYQSLQRLGFKVEESALMVVSKNGTKIASGTKPLSHAQALRRCIKQLYVIWTSILDEQGPDSEFASQLAYVIDFAETRRPTPEPQTKD